jgi:hypothetical protein
MAKSLDLSAIPISLCKKMVLDHLIALSLPEGFSFACVIGHDVGGVLSAKEQHQHHSLTRSHSASPASRLDPKYIKTLKGFYKPN